MPFRTASAARALLLAGSAAIVAIPSQAIAQEAEQVAAEANAQVEDAPAESGEIVVTARRRAEALQDVPIAVTAYSGEQLEREGAIDITDVGDTTPNVTLETSRGTVEMLKRHGIDVDYEETDGGHTWTNWRAYLRDFAPRLFQ